MLTVSIKAYVRAYKTIVLLIQVPNTYLKMLMVTQLTVGNYLMCGNVLLFQYTALNTDSWLFIHDEAPVLCTVYNNSDFIISCSVYLTQSEVPSTSALFGTRAEETTANRNILDLAAEEKQTQGSVSKAVAWDWHTVIFAHIQFTETRSMASLEGNRHRVYERRVERSMIFIWRYYTELFD